MAQQTKYELESQITVLERLFEKQLPIDIHTLKANPKYYALQGKLRKLKKKLKDTKWNDFLAQ